MDNQPNVKKELQKSQFGVSPIPYHLHTGTDSPKIPFNNIQNAPDCFCVATTTSGTVPTPVFGSNGVSFALTITGVFLISLNTTAGNITLTNNGNTVATIAKGTTAGAMVGATSLANTAYSAGNSITVASSSAGNSTLFVTFTV